MRTVLSVFALLALTTTAFARSPFVGTWKLDVDKTKFTAGDAGKNVTLVIDEQGGSLRVTVTATNANGSPFSLKYTLPLSGGLGQVQESSGRLDGIRSRVISSRVRENTYTRGGQQASVRRWTVSEDGLTLTIVESGIDKDGKRFAGTSVLKKQ